MNKKRNRFFSPAQLPSCPAVAAPLPVPSSSLSPVQTLSSRSLQVGVLCDPLLGPSTRPLGRSQAPCPGESIWLFSSSFSLTPEGQGPLPPCPTSTFCSPRSRQGKQNCCGGRGCVGGSGGTCWPGVCSLLSPYPEGDAQATVTTFSVP